jgi:hypothetical protein
MLIAGFGDTYATAAIFPTNIPEDDWTVQRPAAARRVPFAGGTYDFNGANRDALAAYTVRKKFMLRAIMTATITGTGTITTNGTTTITGSGTLFLSEVQIGDLITYSEGARTVVTVISNTALTVSLAADDNPDPMAYTMTGVRENYAYLDTVFEALKRSVLGSGESKLWLEMRDGSRRWAWAKCQKVRQTERVEDRLAVPVELEFYLREGVWYSETLHTGLVSGSSGNATLANAGNIATAVKATVHAGSANITAASVGGKWAFSGTLLAGNDLIVDAARFSAKNNGVGCYGNMTITDPTAVWFLLDTGSHTFTLSWTGGGTGDTFGVEWYDAWV